MSVIIYFSVFSTYTGKHQYYHCYHSSGCKSGSIKKSEILQTKFCKSESMMISCAIFLKDKISKKKFSDVLQ